FELTSERERALELKKRLIDQDKRLEEYFEREKSAVRGFARILLGEAKKALTDIVGRLEASESEIYWPTIAAELHESAQLFDLARSAAEQDVQLVRKAWFLQGS